MKKFKSIQAFEGAKLSKDQMSQATGGLRIRCTCGTRSVCHIDGTDDGDDVFFAAF